MGNYVVQTFQVSTDTQPPKVSISAPLSGTVSATNTTIIGQVTDNLSGVAKLEVRVDGGGYAPVTFDAAGNFGLSTTFALNGSADGMHKFLFRATDAAGNVSTPLELDFTLDTTAPAVSVTSPAVNASLAAGVHLTGTASGTGSALTALSYAIDNGQPVPLSFDAASGAFDQELNLTGLATGAHTLTLAARDAAGNTSTTNVAVTLPAAPPVAVTDFTPTDGATDVGATFRPKVTFSAPIDVTTLNANDFYATDTTGTKLAATIVPSNDHTYAWLFFTNAMPGASTITVTLDGSKIHAANGAPIDAARTGTAGSKLTFSFSTVSESFVPGTTITGIVADPGPDLTPNTPDDVKAGPDGVLMTGDDVYLLPIAHVKVYILGHEDQAIFTDAQGHFSFTSVPVGDVKVGIDGRTATNPPAGYYFPEMVMDLTIQPGMANTVMGSMGSTQQQAATAAVQGVYLPRVQSSILQTVSATQTTEIGLTPQAATGLTPQQASELKIDVAPGSLIGMDGTKMATGQVGISTVPPQLVMDMLPPGLMQHTFDITIQAPGVATFATPAAMTFPNVFHADPGTKLDFLSFDHTTGRLVIDGTATVSADGLTVTTDPGMGITHPGWHGLAPPGDNVGQGPGDCNPTTGNGNNNTNQADFDFIGDQEDHAHPRGTLHTYNPNSGQSGVTVASGVDLNQHPVDTLNVSDDLRTLLEPYSGPNGLAYEAQHGDVNITQAQADALNTAVRPFIMDPLIQAYNNASTIPFNQLPPDAQTVIADLAYQYGSDLATRTPNFWNQVTHQDWQGAVNNLNNFGDAYTNRRHAERDRLQNVLDNGDQSGNQGGDCSSQNGGAGQTTVNDPEPQGGDHYYAIYNLDSGQMEFRGVSRNGRILSTPVFLASNKDYRIYVLDPLTLWTGYHDFTTGVSGQSIGLGTVLIGSRVGTDVDGDGLSNLDEFILGTNPYAFSTAGDNISDLAKLQQGIDLFAATVPPTGVIASLPLQGQAKEVVVVGSTLDPKAQTAYVATGTYGLAVVNASQFNKPILLGQLQLPGNSGDIAFDPLHNLAVVASGSGGLNLVNVSNPATPQLQKTISLSGGAQAVKVYDGLAYVASGGSVVSIDLATGQVVQTLALGGGTLTGLVREGTTLYSMDANKVLRAIDLNGTAMVAKGSLALASGGGQIFVGNGIAYVPVGGTSSAGGYSTVNVSDPTHLTLIAGPSQPNTGKPGTALAANGSGVGLLAGALSFVFGGFTAVDLVSLADPTNTYNFLTRFNLPDAPNGLAIAGGIAYIADNNSGLQVVNYLPFDNKGVPPTVSISTTAPDVDLLTPGLQVREGSVLPIQVNSSDDVQVRNVELLVNGQVVQNAVSFPFDFSAIAPAIAASGNSFTVQVRATDTGGNVGLSNVLTIGLVTDTSPITISNFFPANGSSLLEGVQSVQVTFSKAVAASTVTTANFQLKDAGRNTVTPASTELRSNGTLVELSYAPLLAGAYQFVINGPAVTDNAGHSLSTGNVTDSFTLTPRETLTVSNADADPATPGLQLYEGTTIHAKITVNASVAVQKVDLLLNGQVVATGTTAPFTFAAIAPLLTAGATSITLQARVTDTTGVATVSTPLSVSLLRDTTPPTITSVTPAPNAAAFEGLTTVTVTFSKPIATSSVSAANFHLFKAGTSGVFDGTETAVAITGFALVNDDTQAQLTVAPLAHGTYELRLTKDGITDRPLNPLGTGTFVSDFTVQIQLIQNGSFESGLTGWTVNLASFGSVQTVSSWTAQPFDGTVYAPKDGSAFAVLKSGAANTYATLSQAFTASAGTTITGWAFFDTTDYLPYNDDGYVKIINNATQAILFSASVSTVGNYGETPWTFWHYTFTNSGSYTIQAGVRNLIDSSVDSYLGLDAVQVVNGQPQVFGGLATTASGDTTNLTQEQLQPVVAQAVANLTTAGFNVSSLGQVDFHLSNLPGSLLGLTYQNTIWIDQTAQGYGWYTDVSTSSSAAFTQVPGANEVQADPGSPAYGHVDLLTVVTHELGHVLGFASVDPGLLGHDWMTATLTTGVRRYADAAGGSDLPPVSGSLTSPPTDQTPIRESGASESGSPAATAPLSALSGSSP